MEIGIHHDIFIRVRSVVPWSTCTLIILIFILMMMLTRVKSVVPSQAISVSVSNPQKVGKGLFSYVAYRFDFY